MIYFLLPKTFLFIFESIDYSDSENIPDAFISPSLSNYLLDIKERINIHEKDWDTFKKYTNPYEYIHSIIPNKKKCVSKYKPLSRSYFKMIEIINIFKLNEFYTENRNSIVNNNEPKFILKGKKTPIKTFHLAEGPGGFIEAIVKLRNNPEDSYIGMSILDDKEDLNIPAWKKSELFLKENPNVFIENGIDNTGNILNIENFAYCKEKYESSMDLITADGGFDFSVDFNHQEANISKLLFAQIAYALCMQKKDGSFVIKIFDSFMLHTLDLLYILSSMYKRVYISKPQTSRFANSEKYIVCKKFIYNSCNAFYPYLYKAFDKMLNTEKYVSRYLRIPISNYFLTKMEEFNSIFGQQQIENIYYTLSLIESKNKGEKIDMLIKNNVQKCIKWCIKYNVLYNNILNNTNIFMSETSIQLMNQSNNMNNTNNNNNNVI
jgi:23S rRNA U2552 (ribose-2'-O)-methylase RlmE/FtsJ